MDSKILELAVALHGHLAPGIALGLRMGEIALSHLNMKRGDKHLIAVSETARCLADAVQAATGCTLGHGNVFVENYGKLAIAVGDARSGKGVRVALRSSANKLSPLMNKWMMRLGRLDHEEEQELGKQLLEMDEEYLLIHDIALNIAQTFESSEIVRCSECGDLIPQALTIQKEGAVWCKECDRTHLYYSIKK